MQWTEKLIRAKLPLPYTNRPTKHLHDLQNTWREWTCLICPSIVESEKIRTVHSDDKFIQKCHVNPRTIVCMLLCTKENCIQKNNRKQFYIGVTDRSIKERVCEHIGYINT